MASQADQRTFASIRTIHTTPLPLTSGRGEAEAEDPLRHGQRDAAAHKAP